MTAGCRCGPRDQAITFQSSWPTELSSYNFLSIRASTIYKGPFTLYISFCRPCTASFLSCTEKLKPPLDIYLHFPISFNFSLGHKISRSYLLFFRKVQNRCLNLIVEFKISPLIPPHSSKWPPRPPRRIFLPNPSTLPS
jgi:hypothetical protein